MCGNSRWRRPKLVNIYLLQVGDSNIYKIGYTSNSVKERLRTVRYYIKDIKLISYVFCKFELEKILHTKFKDKNNKNNFGYTEYFELNNEDVDYVINIFNEIRNGKTD